MFILKCSTFAPTFVQLSLQNIIYLFIYQLFRSSLGVDIFHSVWKISSMIYINRHQQTIVSNFINYTNRVLIKMCMHNLIILNILHFLFIIKARLIFYSFYKLLRNSVPKWIKKTEILLLLDGITLYLKCMSIFIICFSNLQSEFDILTTQVK